MKSYDQKVLMQRRRPLTGPFRGTEDLGTYAGHSPKSVGAICDQADFSGVVEVAPGVLGPRHGAVTVHLVEPGQEPTWSSLTEIVTRQVFQDAVPWVVITVGRPG